jgi:hypothetical protein
LELGAEHLIMESEQQTMEVEDILEAMRKRDKGELKTDYEDKLQF